MKKRVFSCLLAVVLLLCFVYTAPAASAARDNDPGEWLYGGAPSEITDPELAAFVNGYEGNELPYSVYLDDLYIDHYDVDMTVTSARSVEVVETLRICFNEEMHGYERYIPTYGAEELYRISNVKAEGAEALIEEYENEVYIRLGSEFFTVTGFQTYTISYTIEYFNDITSGADRIYQNIFPGELEDRVINATARIRMPENAGLIDYLLYSGSYGSKESKLNSFFSGDVLYIYSTEAFRANEGATVELLFPEGTFAPRPADISVTHADFDLTVNRDGSYVFQQYLTVDVSESASSTMLPLWQQIIMDDADHDSQMPGTDHVRIAAAVNGESVLSLSGVHRYVNVDLSACKGQTVTVTSVQKGQLEIPDGDFALAVSLTPISYSNSGFIEYSGVSVIAHLPSEEGAEVSCDSSITTGSASKEYFFVTEPSDDGFVSQLSGTLPVGESVNAVIALPYGAVTRSTNWADWTVGIGALALIIFAAAMRLSKKKRSIVPTMEFYPPDNLNPAEMGFIIDGKADPEDMTSLIYYWASKGCLTIEITGKKTFTLHKLTDLPEGSRSYESTMFKKLWSLGGNDGTVTSNQLKENFYYTLTLASAQLARDFSSDKRRLVEKSSTVMSSVLAIAAVAAGAAATLLSLLTPANTGSELMTVISLIFFVPSYLLIRNLWGSGAEKKSLFTRIMTWIGSLVLCAVGALVFMALLSSVAVGYIPALLMGIAVPVALCAAPGMRTNSEYGAYIIGRSLGFKQFLQTAEKSRLEMLLEENPEYYYDILPYAQVLGVSSIWSDKFKDLTVKAPEWFYGDDVTTATARYMMLRNFTTMNTAMRSVPVSSGTGSHTGRFGGFSGGGGSFGGGFSGGGGGGGGGGGW